MPNSLTKTQQEVFDALQWLGGRATARQIANKLGKLVSNVVGLLQRMEPDNVGQEIVPGVIPADRTWYTVEPVAEPAAEESAAAPSPEPRRSDMGKRELKTLISPLLPTRGNITTREIAAALRVDELAARGALSTMREAHYEGIGSGTEYWSREAA